MNEVLLTGNEAIARGFWEAGGRFVSAYPGTPSTEITENAAKYAEIIAEWAPNEKVAMEAVIGASIGGVRTLVAMKHVGLNVAADPLFTVAYTGVNGGLVIVSADDPGMHSSQNEQDNRYYGRAAKVPVLEPSDSQEALDFTKEAFTISEAFDTPVILRLTTRVAHSQSLVKVGDRLEFALKEYHKDPAKYVMIPANARRRHVVVEKRLADLQKYNNTSVSNQVEYTRSDIGIICSGIIYQYVKEVIPEANILKIGMSFPLPEDLIREFASKVKELYVIEELEPFMEEKIKSMGIAVKGREVFSPLGEIFPANIARVLLGEKADAIQETPDIPGRPPVMCAGCPHRAVFYLFNKLKLTVSGDIGCYTLACLPPLSSIDTTICMGASIGVAHGLEKAQGREFSHKTVAVLGESTFIHSGITGLINVAYNQSAVTTVILDNRITAMTGHQHNPASGFNAKGEPAPALDLPKLVKACGIEHVAVVDPFNLPALENALKEAMSFDGPSVIITKRPCILLDKKKQDTPFKVDEDACIGCKICLRIGCPALGLRGKKAFIEPSQCVGCGLCENICPRGAIQNPVQKGDIQ